MDREIALSQKHAKNRNYCYEIPPVVVCTLKKQQHFFCNFKSNRFNLCFSFKYFLSEFCFFKTLI